MRRPASALIPVILAAALAFSAACQKPSDRQRILSLVSDLARAAEKDETRRILDRLDDGYSDFEGRTKAATGDMLEGYFSRYPAIVANILRTDIEELGPQEAAVTADVALSWGAAKVLRKLAQVSLSQFRFRLEMRKNGDAWLIVRVSWRPLEAGEIIFPSDKEAAVPV